MRLYFCNRSKNRNTTLANSIAYLSKIKHIKVVWNTLILISKIYTRKFYALRKNKLGRWNLKSKLFEKQKFDYRVCVFVANLDESPIFNRVLYEYVHHQMVVQQILKEEYVYTMILIQINVVIMMMMTSLQLLCVVLVEEELQVIVTNCLAEEFCK